MNDKIVCAACRIGGIIFCGARHFDMIMHHQLHGVYGERAYPKSDIDEQGFINQRGEFLSREEAFKVAKAAGQLEGRVKTDYPDSTTLYSEDLY